ncbi:MAG: S53 family peptidase [Candidatus Acidiferrales bacterium]
MGALPLAAQTNTAAPRITQAINNSKLAVLRGNVHPMARPEYDRGIAPASLPMEHMLLVLKRSPQQEAALETLLAQQEDKSSPDYHKWLTPAQFGAEFGPADQDVQTVTSWLQSQGFTVNNVSKGRTVIDFSGSAGEVQSAFHTAIHRYVLPNGKQHWANSTDPEIPVALAPVVAGIRSLNNFFPKPHHVAAFHPAFERPNYTYPYSGCNPSVNDCFDVSPADFHTIYNIPTTATGVNQTIAIVSDSDVETTDLQQFRTLFNLPAMTINAPGSPTACQTSVPCFSELIPPGQTDPGVQSCNDDGDECEAILDVEWAGAPATGANIDLVSSADTSTSFGGDLSATYIVNSLPVSVLSTSYGSCEFELGTAGNQFYDSTWQQAAAEGITVVAAAADDGSAGCDNFDASDGTPQPAEGGIAVDGTASTPYDVAVGGTDFNQITNPLQFWSSTNDSNSASALGYIPETTWNDSCTNTLVLAAVGYSSNAITDCNNGDLTDQVLTVGGGGGASSCVNSNFDTTTGTGSISSCADPYPKPSWQIGSGASDNVRDIPDVSLFAGNGFVGSSYMMCESDESPQNGAQCSLADPPSPNSASASFGEVGGTSLSAQAFAGIVALLDQQAGDRQGNINPLLYSLAAQSGDTCGSAASPASTCVFYDVTTGTNSQPCNISTTDGFAASPNCTGSTGDAFGVIEANGQLAYNAGAGYDLATGLGSVNVGNLLGKWPTTPGFLLSSLNPYITLASSSSSGTISFSVVSQNGFSGTIDFSSATCSGLPSGFTCSVSPSPATLSAGGSVTETLTIQPTSGGNAVPTKLMGFWTPNEAAIASVPLCCIFALVLFALDSSKRKRSLRWAALAVVLVGLGAAAGCGGGGGGGGGSSPGGSGVTTTTATLTVVAGGQTQAMNFDVTLK